MKLCFLYSQNKIHLLSSNSHSPYYCDGGGDFSCNSDLTEHPLQSDERPFYCEICDVKFPWGSMLQVHQNVHSEINRTICLVCPRMSVGESVYG